MFVLKGQSILPARWEPATLMHHVWEDYSRMRRLLMYEETTQKFEVTPLREWHGIFSDPSSENLPGSKTSRRWEDQERSGMTLRLDESMRHFFKLFFFNNETPMHFNFWWKRGNIRVVKNQRQKRTTLRGRNPSKNIQDLKKIWSTNIFVRLKKTENMMNQWWWDECVDCGEPFGWLKVQWGSVQSIWKFRYVVRQGRFSLDDLDILGVRLLDCIWLGIRLRNFEGGVGEKVKVERAGEMRIRRWVCFGCGRRGFNNMGWTNNKQWTKSSENELDVFK